MEETLVFIDEGFLDKLTLFFGKNDRIKFDKFEFAQGISRKQGLLCKRLFYYTCPPFQSETATENEIKRKRGYDKFISALMENQNITLREGRLQKIINQKGEIEFNQKEIDVLLTIDLNHIKEDYPNIKKIILVSSDTDFCPAIRDIKSRYQIEVTLYTYFDRERNSRFSLSNELINCCSKCVKLLKEDFTSYPIKIKPSNNKT